MECGAAARRDRGPAALDDGENAGGVSRIGRGTELAREAERLADHEVDQAFAQSLRQATAETRHLTGEALALQQRVTELQQTVKEDQERYSAHSRRAVPRQRRPPAPVPPSPAGDDLDVAKAQLGLDQDE